MNHDNRLLHSTLFTRRWVIYGLSTGALASILPGCGITANVNGAPDPANSTQPAPPGPHIPATLSVSTTASGGINPGFAGLSYEKSKMSELLFNGTNNNLIGLFKGIRASLLRIGGNSVDWTYWNAAGKGQTSGEIAPSDIDALAAFLKATGWQVLYGINLAQSTPALAASEVAYAVQSLGSSLAGIEIGNEPDLYQGRYFAEFSYSDYFERWSQFAAAILEQAPEIPLTGPALAGNHISSWTLPFVENLSKQKLSLITQHYYRGDGQSPSSTIDLLLSLDTNLTTLNNELQSVSQRSGIPYRLAETNSFFNGGATGVSNSFASALWVIDLLFNIAIRGGVGANFHGGGDSDGYTPIADNNGAVVEARPEYYGILLFTLVGTGPVLKSNLSVKGVNASAYAVKAQGGTNILIVNKDATRNLQFVINLPHPVQAATLLQMSGPSLDATDGVTIQGATVNPDGSFSPEAAYSLAVSGTRVAAYVNAASAVLVQAT